jgi:hypothetical protein
MIVCFGLVKPSSLEIDWAQATTAGASACILLGHVRDRAGDAKSSDYASSRIADRSGEAGQGCKIAGFASIVVDADYELIDLVKTKPRNLDWRVSDNQLLEFSFQVANVPNTFLS